MREAVVLKSGPAALGPYSHAIKAGGFVFCSGQLPIGPVTGVVVEGEVGEQTRQVLENLQTVLESAGAKLSDVVKTTVFLQKMTDFAAMNEVYATFFPSSPPARSTVEVARLPKDALVEIEAVALGE